MKKNPSKRMPTSFLHFNNIFSLMDNESYLKEPRSYAFLL